MLKYNKYDKATSSKNNLAKKLPPLLLSSGQNFVDRKNWIEHFYGARHERFHRIKKKNFLKFLSEAKKHEFETRPVFFFFFALVSKVYSLRDEETSKL